MLKFGDNGNEIYDRVIFASGTTTEDNYLDHTSTKMSFTVGTMESLSYDSSRGYGQFHGNWLLDFDGGGIGGMSDRRLKENIEPLRNNILSKWKVAEPEEVGGQAMTDWILRAMRPVSYSYKSDTENVRFGFVADEIESFLPEVLRKSKDLNETTGIIYQDILAVMTTALQDLGDMVSKLRPRVVSLESRVQRQRELRAHQ